MKAGLLFVAAVLTLAVPASEALAQTGMAYGKVVDEKGQPVPDAKVEFDYREGAKRHYEAKTDKKGNFRQFMTFGRYQVTASKEGHQGAQTEVKVETGDTAPISDLVIVTTAAATKAAEQSHPILGPLKKAVDLTQAGKLDEAQAIYEELLTKDASLPEVHYNLGALCLQKKDLVRAEVEFKRVLELLPNQREAFVALSRVHEEQGEREKALEILKQATDIHKDDASMLYDLGILYLNLGRREEAEKTLERVEVLDPARIGVQYALGTAAVNRGDVPEAVRRLEKYVASAPEGAPNLETAKKLLAELKKAAPTSR